MEQEYYLENADSFVLKDIFECGQCFRWKLEENGTYTGVFKGNVLNISQEKNKIIFKGICRGDIKEIVEDYFDLRRDYKKIKDRLCKKDRYVKRAIKYGEGIRILNQDLWETTISFIISANNNIPRIKRIIETLSKTYGKKIKWGDRVYYSFPTVKELSKASIQDLRCLGLGFRDKRVYETTQKFLNKEVNLKELKKLTTGELRDKLCELSGVGEKVADCIMLFSELKRIDVFPVDVWVRKVMNELFIKKDIEKVSNTEIQVLANAKYGNLKGLAQQYLFYWKRENS
ncbi:MAG: DNA glycosylase [Clostridia bacterium]|nr:DNA glycosylase [Clostridia bacterium]